MSSEASLKELEFTLRARNNRLKERRLRLGMTQPQFAEAAHVGSASYGNLETMKLHPQHRDGSWRDIALALSSFHGVEPEELFPPAVLAVNEPVVVRRVDGHDLHELMTTHQQKMIEGPADAYERVETGKQIIRSLGTLSPREEEVLRIRFGLDGGGEHTLDEVSEKIGVTRERTRQIEAKGLRKLRHPSRSENLQQFLPRETKTRQSIGMYGTRDEGQVVNESEDRR